MILTPASTLHLYLVFAMVALTFGVWFLMGKRRFSAVKSGQVRLGYFKLFQGPETSGLPEAAEMASRNYVNLFEMPVLFYLLVCLLIITQKADYVSLGLLWVFVFFRYVHSLIHVTKNKLIWRMRTHLASALFLIAVWIKFFIQIAL